MTKQFPFEHKIEVGTLVRWPEFPNKLYLVKGMNINHCGNSDYCKIETIDHKEVAMTRIGNLLWDDVDYVES